MTKPPISKSVQGMLPWESFQKLELISCDVGHSETKISPAIRLKINNTNVNGNASQIALLLVMLLTNIKTFLEDYGGVSSIENFKKTL